MFILVYFILDNSIQRRDNVGNIMYSISLSMSTVEPCVALHSAEKKQLLPGVKEQHSGRVTGMDRQAGAAQADSDG